MLASSIVNIIAALLLIAVYCAMQQNFNNKRATNAPAFTMIDVLFH
ncbi:hypothetical protein M527_05915 [Sphingobium indicum IP26]|nr:hypothetical protein M527_05915 [Sphingobium indicum IP26]